MVGDWRSRPQGASFERRLRLGIVAVLLPALMVIGLLLYQLRPLSTLNGFLLGFAALATLILAARLFQRVVYPLYTLSNLLEALREGDYSLRGSRAHRGDAIGDVIWEVNTLSHTLREQRLRVEEATALLGKVIEAIDIALFSFDDRDQLRLINPAGERLLGMRDELALGQTAQALQLEFALDARQHGTIARAFPGGSGRFDVRTFGFREGGRPHRLIAVSDLSTALREEERLAWQRLIRVLGHELNNSLAPVKSLAETLHRLVRIEPPPEDWREDVEAGLKVIADRAASLSRFMQAYSTLAKLPPPNRRPLVLLPLLQGVVRLETRVPIAIQCPAELAVLADPDQLEQALINLLRNAAEACQETGGEVELIVESDADWVKLQVVDEGPGIAAADNLFVPFFTTKPGGSGIGLALARQIAESHGGRLSLENRRDAQGCVACLSLPVQG
ncbi:sensor histidine kinase [Pseudomarimonas arenosa]|uniref:histidine kinase n=1 Tax=Pseudomarimonas arenosa TaxID=2774145 RepID=A0AAW3ZSQ2_9GAMM|nr:ATP-binding protein [Pseudomarimonas arenosa]MBD8528062.1 histidine kinase [Pseudomarimonas arenosa]